MTVAGSASRSTLRTEGASEAGSSGVRTTSAKPRWRSESGKKRSGSLVGLLGSARYFISLTTPTMVCQGFCDMGPPCLMRLPMGSCPGQKRLATASLTITTFDAPCNSVSLKVRPASSGMRIVLKNSALTRWT